MKKNLEKLFNPGSVAIVGATDKEGKIGNVILKNLLELGFSGEVFPVNPKYDEVSGKKCYSSVSDIESEVDLVVVAIPASFVNQTIVESAKKSKNFIVISAGFSEIGEDGKKLENELGEIARENNLNILGPNCLGIISPKAKLNASFAGGMPEEGGVAFISQSGALAVALMDVSGKERIKFSSVVSVGNKMQLDESDLVEYFGEDPDTKVIALYLEGLKDGKRFIEVAKKISKKKPVIILKAGKTEKSQAAISSHTGALAGSNEIMNVAFEKAGIIHADNLEEFFDLIKLISNYEVKKSTKCAIITNAGGPGVLATDDFKDKFIKLSEMSEKAQKSFRNFLPNESSVKNPIDLLGDADDVRYEEALRVLNEEGIENIFCIMTAQDQTPVVQISKVICDFIKKTDKNVFPVFIGGEKMKKALSVLNENDVTNFEFSKRVIDSLNQYYSWAEKMKEEEDELAVFEADKERREKAEEIIDKAKSGGRKALLFGEAAEVMRLYGIKTVDFLSLSPNDELSGEMKFDFPVAVKVDSDTVLHKTDKQGLILGIKDQNELEVAVEKIRANFPGERVVVQPMIQIENEIILGMKRDSVFGGVMVYGLGGIYTEIFKLVNFMIPPVSRKEIEKNIKESKVSFLFEEVRGKKVSDLEEMTDVVLNFSALIQEVDEILEIDINPLLINKKGELVAVDVKIML